MTLSGLVHVFAAGASMGLVDLPYRHTKKHRIYIRNITDKGLRAIGELPDPQRQLIQGFEAAIEAIKRDESLSAEEKKHRIEWLEEGKLLARSLATDAIKAILTGALV